MSKQNYGNLLSALSQASVNAQEAAADTLLAGNYATSAEGMEIAYVNLWDALLNALIAHADCDHADLLGIVAGTLQMGVPMPAVQVPAVMVPVVGTIGPNGRVSWNSGRGA